jgi:uncharacterized DUF497 family protein
LQFDWDEEKAKVNIRMHEVSFEEAESVFDDRLSATFQDPDHSLTEDRRVIIGLSEQERLLIVNFTWRGEIIRLISARRPTKQEIREYEEGKKPRR